MCVHHTCTYVTPSFSSSQTSFPYRGLFLKKCFFFQIFLKVFFFSKMMPHYLLANYSEAELELSSSSLLLVSQTGFFLTTAGFVVAFFSLLLSLSLELELLLSDEEEEEEEEEKARVRVLRFLFGFTNGVVVVAAAGWGPGLLVVLVDWGGDVLFR